MLGKSLHFVLLCYWCHHDFLPSPSLKLRLLTLYMMKIRSASSKSPARTARTTTQMGTDWGASATHMTQTLIWNEIFVCWMPLRTKWTKCYCGIKTCSHCGTVWRQLRHQVLVGHLNDTEGSWRSDLEGAVLVFRLKKKSVHECVCACVWLCINAFVCRTFRKVLTYKLAEI